MADESLLVVNGLDVSDLNEEYLGLIRKGGVDVWHKSVGGGVRAFADAHNFVDKHSDEITVVRTVSEMHQAKSEDKIALLFGWQDANTISSGRAGSNDWWGDPPKSELRAYYELGLRVCGIAYQIANIFGGGATDGHIGLSRAGRALVEEIHHLGMVLDVGGHTGDQASLDAIEMSSGMPIICSHGGVRALANSSRNLSDKTVEAIAKTGGVIGTPAINDFLVRGREMAHMPESPWGSVDNFIAHVEHVRDLVGPDHVGIGTDFTTRPGNPTGQMRDRALFGPETMDEGPRRFVKGFENVSELPNVVRALEEREWPEEHVQKFLGGNWLRVYQQVWGK